jgi:hypothetical protein
MVRDVGRLRLLTLLAQFWDVEPFRLVHTLAYVHEFSLGTIALADSFPQVRLQDVLMCPFCEVYVEM